MHLLSRVRSMLKNPILAIIIGERKNSNFHAWLVKRIISLRTVHASQMSINSWNKVRIYTGCAHKSFPRPTPTNGCSGSHATTYNQSVVAPSGASSSFVNILMADSVDLIM